MHTFPSSFLATILEHLPFFVALKDAATRRYVLANSSFSALVGRAKEEIKGKRDEEILGEQRASEQRGLEDRAVETGRPVEVPAISVGERTLTLTLVPLSEDGRTVRYLLVSGTDITDRQLALQELNAQKDFIRQVIDTDPNLIFVKDRQGKFVLTNQALADLYGKTIEEITGQNNAAVNPNAAEVSSYALADQEVLTTMREVNVVEPVTLADGRRRWHHTIKRPLVRPGGEVQILAICADITELKEAREHAEQVAHELERKADEAQREAVAKASLADALDGKLEIIEAQNKLIRSLSLPLLDVGGDVLAVPLIGIMDEQRAVDVTDRLLQAIAERRVRHVILDLTGIEAVDASAVQHLLRIVSAVRLLGARALISGISPAIAEEAIALGVDLSGVVTKRTLRDALRACAPG